MDESDRVLEVLKRARALLAPEGAWCQGVIARGKRGVSVDPRGGYAVSFCAAGALLAAGDSGHRANNFLFSHLPYQQPIAIGDWNDLPERTHQDVLDVFDRAIAARLSGAS